MRKMIIAGAFAAILFILSVAGCKVDQAELYGNYLADHELANEKLTLNKDGSYIQEVTIKATSEVTVATGSWNYDQKDGYLTFNENFIVVTDAFGRFNPNYAHPKPGSAIIPVANYFGDSLIEVAEGVYLKKTLKEN